MGDAVNLSVATRFQISVLSLYHPGRGQGVFIGLAKCLDAADYAPALKRLWGGGGGLWHIFFLTWKKLWPGVHNGAYSSTYMTDLWADKQK